MVTIVKMDGRYLVVRVYNGKTAVLGSYKTRRVAELALEYFQS